MLILLFVLCYGVMYAQENRTEFTIEFRVARYTIDPNFRNNARELSELDTYIKRINANPAYEVTGITIYGTASPEGSYELNKRLANGRAQAVEDYLTKRMNIADSLITRVDEYIPWDKLTIMVETSTLPQKDEVLAVIAEQPERVPYRGNSTIDHRVLKLQKIDNGRVWSILNKDYFGRLRNTSLAAITVRNVLAVDSPAIGLNFLAPNPRVSLPALAIAPIVEPVEPEVWHRYLHLKTNALGWPLMLANVAAELVLCKHLSFSLPVYYSALNYFTSTIKFRAFGFQPELRYWFDEDNTGWFVAGHFGLAWYNIATNGDWRIQDHNRNTPAIGGGANAGYRMAIGKLKRWNLEFSLGVGAYKLHFDKFINERNGQYAYSMKKTYVGLDNAAVTFSYAFDLTKKGKR